jgi:single-stranded DNA-binding protein
MYGTVEEGTAYLENNMYSDEWLDADNEQRTRALVHASRIIDTLQFKGTRSDPDQSGQFPRTEVGTPEAVENAAYEIALALMQGNNPEQQEHDRRVTSTAFSVIRHSYDPANQPDYIRAGVPSATAWRLLLPYLVDSVSFARERVN